jgi:hypothetical protein
MSFPVFFPVLGKLQAGGQPDEPGKGKVALRKRGKKCTEEIKIMKKIIASAVGLMLAGGVAATTASAAVENQFGGYWRTRFTFEDSFDGHDSASREYVDTRTRLYYTAKFNDGFKFVNKFEFNTGWGDQNGGDLGADGKGNWRVKNSYADFNMGTAVNAKVGIQGGVIARGFILDDDFAGAVVTPKFGNVSVPIIWANISNEDVQSWDGAVVPTFNQNLFAVMAAIKINDGMSITPYAVYHPITDHNDLAGSSLDKVLIEDSDNYYLGVDADMKFDTIGVWATGIFNGGDINGQDTVAFLGAAGVDAGIVHGQAFYATGDDDATDGDNDAFISAPGLGANLKSPGVGSSYYWSEIMGLGVFDNAPSNGSPGDDITNIWAVNAGVTIKPMDKLKVTVDAWYAALAEDNILGDSELGLEFDGKVSYNIYDNLTADAIFAYLISGDATGDEDVMEGGVRLSLSF